MGSAVLCSCDYSFVASRMECFPGGGFLAGEDMGGGIVGTMGWVYCFAFACSLGYCAVLDIRR